VLTHPTPLNPTPATVDQQLGKINIRYGSQPISSHPDRTDGSVGGRTSDALLYARAALGNFEQAGPGAASYVDLAQQRIADLEQRSR
jgi:hypothetical protein